MLRVNSISNVNNTLNNKVRFGSGVQTNYGLQATTQTIPENGFVAGFVGAIKESRFFNKEVQNRADKIEKNMNAESNKLNLIA